MIWDLIVAFVGAAAVAIGITLAVCTLLARRYGRWWEQ